MQPLAIVRLPFDDAAKKRSEADGRSRKEVNGNCRDEGVVKHVDYGMQVFVKRGLQVVKAKRSKQKILQKVVDEEKKMLHNLVSLLLTNKTI